LRSCCWRVTPSHGSLRVQHLELRPACRLLCMRYLLHCAALGSLRARHPALCAAPGSLRARRLARRAGLRIAPYADTLRPCAVPGLLRSRHLSPAPPQITLCPTLDALCRLRIAPPPSVCALVLPADCSVFSTSSFASNPDRSVSDTCYSAPYSNYFVYDTWLFVPLTDFSALFT